MFSCIPKHSNKVQYIQIFYHICVYLWSNLCECEGARLHVHKTPSPDSKDTEVALESRVDGERAGSGVHGPHILDVVDVLEGVFGSVVPVAIVHVLPDQSVRLHSPVLIHL